MLNIHYFSTETAVTPARQSITEHVYCKSCLRQW